MSKVTLDRETFKALASETRLQVLHALDERRKTGSELARELELNKATVHEHLGILEATGLVVKKDEGRKWVYWELTWNGSKLLHPGQEAVFSVLLGVATLALGGFVAMLGAAMGWWFRQMDGAGQGEDNMLLPPTEESADSAATAEGENDTSAEVPAEGSDGAQERMLYDTGDGGSFFDDGGWIAIALLLTSILAVAMAVWLRRRK